MENFQNDCCPFKNLSSRQLRIEELGPCFSVLVRWRTYHFHDFCETRVQISYDQWRIYICQKTLSFLICNLSTLCQLKQHLLQNNIDARVIRLSNRDIHFQIRLAMECVFLFIYVIRSMHVIKDTERVVISSFQSAVAILTFRKFPSSPITYLLA